MKRRLVETGDGSHSLYVDELKEHYHSWNGALEESRHVYLGHGWEVVKTRFSPEAPLHVLEIGLGTGLNALLTLLAADREIYYTAIEAYPVTPEEAALLNYPELIGEAGAREAFTDLHAAPLNSWHELRPGFHLYKHTGLIEDYTAENEFHLVYFDAFAPNKQPHLWENPIFANMHRAMQAGARLTTYCAKGAVRRSLQALGFQVTRQPGPPGKREMLVADRVAQTPPDEAPEATKPTQ
ncbi:MAG: tRNA (5-methylaminomethyl-2-thiouridine)(34)-methyltransferase MnmD [Bacteroidota bacterium]